MKLSRVVGVVLVSALALSGCSYLSDPDGVERAVTRAAQELEGMPGVESVDPQWSLGGLLAPGSSSANVVVHLTEDAGVEETLAIAERFSGLGLDDEPPVDLHISTEAVVSANTFDVSEVLAHDADLADELELWFALQQQVASISHGFDEEGRDLFIFSAEDSTLASVAVSLAEVGDMAVLDDAPTSWSIQRAGAGASPHSMTITGALPPPAVLETLARLEGDLADVGVQLESHTVLWAEGEPVPLTVVLGFVDADLAALDTTGAILALRTSVAWRGALAGLTILEQGGEAFRYRVGSPGPGTFAVITVDGCESGFDEEFLAGEKLLEEWGGPAC